MQSRNVRAAGFFAAVLCASSGSAQGSDPLSPQQPSDILAQLTGVQGASTTGGNVYYGGQNFTLCCLKAVDYSLTVINGSLENTTDWIQLSSPEDLVDASNRGQFPCNAVYNKDDGGAPVVTVPFDWFVDTCPGWQMSDRTNLNAWLQPLSGFVIPAVPLIFSIPLRRRFEVPSAFFPARISSIKSWLTALLGILGATLIVIVDTIWWLSICFAFAAPMILSGLYEARLDHRMLVWLEKKIKDCRLTLDMRARCLMVILIGNLDLGQDSQTTQNQSSIDQHAPASTGRPPQVGDLPFEIELGETAPRYHDGLGSPPSMLSPSFETENYDRVSLAPSQLSTQPLIGPKSPTTSLVAQKDDSPWDHMEDLLHEIRLFDSPTLSQGKHSGQGMPHNRNTASSQDPDHKASLRLRDEDFENAISKMKTRLRSMLHCQSSFGTTVGAPIVFFISGFIFAYLQSVENMGDENIAEALAFGQWYMIIPHIAIVTGLLLAGNNPNILEGVLAPTKQKDHEGDDVHYILGLLPFGLAYPSCYKTAWQWKRGRSKKQWIEKVHQTFKSQKVMSHLDAIITEEPDPYMKELGEQIHLSILDWLGILALCIMLVFVPLLLAFLTAYFTPAIGLACHSLTFAIYGSCQIAQVGLWFWANYDPPQRTSKDSEDRQRRNSLRKSDRLRHRSFYVPSMGVVWHESFKLSWRQGWPTAKTESRSSWPPLRLSIYPVLVIVFSIISTFAALGGTLMQLIGVYRTNMCYITSNWWLTPPVDRPPVVISTNTQLMIQMATQFWGPCAITALIFLAVVSFGGWCYQRMMRDYFGRIVTMIDEADYDTHETTLSRQLGNSARVS